MVQLFDTLIGQATDSLMKHGFVRRLVPERYAQRQSDNGVAIYSHWYAHPLGTEMKCAYLLSARMEIMNMMIYPRRAESVPIFAVEYIAFGGKPMVAVADLQPALGHGPLTDEVVASLQSYQGMTSVLLTPGGELPEWAKDYFTPVCIYSRPNSIDQAMVLRMAFNHYLNIWLSEFFSRETGEVTGECALLQYQGHHIEHTPGRPFLRKTFGEEWTEDYLGNFMYCREESISD